MSRITSTLCALAGLALAIGSPVLLAQATTGEIRGTVSTAEDGSALPGATITALYQPTGTQYTSVTGADGKFQIPNVRVGSPYRVTASLDNFQPQVATDVAVQLGETVNLKFELALATIEETVEVVAESTPLINPGRTGAASNVSTAAIESLPTVNRDFNDFARTNPFMTVASNNEDPDSISVAGRNSRYNSITIDGSVNNDLFGLADTGTPGGQSGTTPISLDAIQELELVIAEFDVRNGGFSGGLVNAITRSGTNSYKGSVFGYYRDDSFFGDGPDVLGELGDFEETQYGFRLGGPIAKDKAFFFVNADLEERTRPSGWSIDGSSGQAFADGTLVEEAQRFREILIDRYGFDPGGLGEDSQDNPSDKLFGRLDVNLAEGQAFTIRHNYVDAARDVNRPDSFTYEWPSEAYDFQTETNSTVAQLNSVFSSSMFGEGRLAYQVVKDRRAGRDGVTFPWIEIEDVNGFAAGRNEFEAGTEPFSTRNAVDQDILELHYDLTWLKGDHTITLGTHNELFQFENLFIQNAFGSYQFASLDAFEAGIARQFDYTEVPAGQPAAQKFEVNQLGLYAGDQWAMRDDLTLSYGLRVDVPYFPDTPSRNPFTEETYGFRTDEIPDGEILWQPRLGFNWDVLGKGTSQLRGGAGVFAGRTPYVWISNNYARTGIEQIFVQCNNVPFNPDPFGQSSECAAQGSVGEFNLIAPDFEFPQVLRYSLAYDHQLPWWGLVASAELLYSDSLEEIDYQNVNLQQIGTTFDGRPRYERVDPAVTGAFLITNTSEGEATNFSLKLERPFRDGLWGYVSYAYNDTEVVNEGTSSRAVSNYNFNEAFDPNNAGTSASDFEVEHRFNASVSYELNRNSDWPTTVSLFYNHQSGRPFSWIMGSDFVAFGFGQSYNGDGTDGNDLAFVPAAEGDVVITNGTWADLDAFINANPVLDANRGGLVPRNADQAPWSHTLDLHLAQQIPVSRTHLEVTFDVLNLMNLIDEDSGTLRFVNFSALEAWEVEGFTEDGTPIISLNNVALGRSDKFQTHSTVSRWRAKLGLRWTF